MKKLLIYIVATAAVATACRRSEIQQDEEGRSLQLEIARAPFDEPDSLQRASRATETAFEALDSIGVYVHTTPKVTAVGNHTPNLLYSTADGSTWNAGGHLSDVPQGGKTYTATGYYPYDRLLIDPTAFVFSVAGDQTTAKAVTQSDLMVTAPTAITNPTSAPTLALQFKHLFSKISVKFAVPPSIDGAVVQKVERVDLRGVFRAATVNLSDGSLTSPDNKGDITMLLVSGDATTAGSEVVYEAIALPQTIKKGDLLVELTFATGSGNRTFTYRPTADEVWTGNLKRNLHLVSVGDLCFGSYLDLTDGLAHTGLELKIKAPAGANWTLTSPGAWLTLCDTQNGTYAASISGTGTGAEQTVYVSVTANTSAVGGVWLARSAALSLSAGSVTTRYTAQQNYYRFGSGEAVWTVEAGQSVKAVAPFVSNQEWKAVGSADWLQVSSSGLWGEGSPVQEYSGGGSVGSNGLFAHFEANNTASERTGTLTITPATAGGTATVTTVNQPLAVCTVAPRAVEVSKLSSTATALFTVTVPKGVRWKVVSATAGGLGDMNLSTVPSVGAEQLGTGEPQQVVGSYGELMGDAVRWSDVVVAWASYGGDQQATVRVRQNLEAVLLDNVWWATGNLVATGARGAAGLGGCAIGAPSDGGLYFQFGSLIGYKGGNQANGGTGVGMPQAPLTTNGAYWNGAAAWSWANESHVWPTNMSGSPAAWPTNTTNQWYFGLQTGWSTAGQDIRDFPNLASGGLSNVGVGDPCTYYLGAGWRFPTTNEIIALCNNQKPGYGAIMTTWGSCNASWTSTPVNGGNFASNQLFFPAAGYRYASNGSFHNLTTYGTFWSSLIYDGTYSFYLTFISNGVYPQNYTVRSYGFPVRCVAEFVDTKAWTAPIAGATKTVKVFAPKGQSWTASIAKGEGLTLTGGSGNGAGSFTLTYAATTANSTRGGIVRVTCGSITYDIKVVQTDQVVEVNGTWWTKGNLVASSSTAGARGEGGCKIGAPADGGLFFQFGSLIGYKGGAQTNGGTGVGSNPYTGSSTQWWGGKTAYSWANDAMVWPSELVGTKATWTNKDTDNVSTLSDYYFNYSLAPWETVEQNIRDFSVSIAGDKGAGTLATGRYAKQGVGDPCTYYLGGTWRLPTTAEYKALCNNQGGGDWLSWATVGGSWTTTPTYGGNFYSNKLFFPASGGRNNSNGSFYNVTTNGYYWSSSVHSATHGYTLAFHQPNGVFPQLNYGRSRGFPVRCVLDL